MRRTTFTIIIGCLNAGKKLKDTFESVRKQTFCDYEVLIKDGGSTDGSVDRILREEEELAHSPTAPCLRVIKRKDRGIYDAMNQAVKEAEGEYILFLNCGDKLADGQVLKKTGDIIKKVDGRGIYYGDIYSEKTRTSVAAPREITGFTCYRNIPCHQACFYHRSLFENGGFETDYRIRADYDHFLRCFYREGAAPLYCGFTVASYEGGGYSESKENRKRDQEEHRLITKTYMTGRALFLYRGAMLLTLAPLRRHLAESPVLAGLYQGIKRMLYKKGAE